MAIRLEDLGGTPWADGNILDATDLTDTILAGGLSFAPISAEQSYKTLAASLSYINGGSTAAEDFTSAGGANGTVNDAPVNNLWGVTDNESITGEPTTNNLGYTEFQNKANAKNGSDSNYAFYEYNQTSASGQQPAYYFGHTFPSTKVLDVSLNAYINNAYSSYAGTLQSLELQTFNGSIWTTHTVLADKQNTQVNTTISINSEIQGIRIKWAFYLRTSYQLTARLYKLSYTTTGVTNAIFSSNKYELGAVKDPEIDGENTNYDWINKVNFFDFDTANFASIQSTNSARYAYLGYEFTAPKYIGIINIKFKFWTNSTAPVMQKKVAGVWVAVAGSVIPNYGSTVATTVTVNDTVDGLRMYMDSTSGTTNTHEFWYIQGIPKEYLTSSDVVCDTNTLAVDNETNAFALHWQGNFPTDTSGSFDLTSGGDTINLPVNSTTKKTDVVPKGALTNVSNLIIKAKLETTDTNVTPTINGWGITKL